MEENGVLSLSRFAVELQAECPEVDRKGIRAVLGPLQITPKRMSNGKAIGVDRADRDRVRRFFTRGVKVLN